MFSDNFIEYESNGYRYKNLALSNIYKKFEENLKNLINVKKCMKNETIKILFVSSKDTWREHQMYLKSENNTSMVASETNKLIKLLYNSLLTNYQGNKSEKSERS